MRIFNVAIVATIAVLVLTDQAFAGQAIEVPEPASFALLAIGAGGVVLARLRRKNKR